MAERGKDFASLISSNSVFLALVLTLGAAWLNREAPLQGARPGTDKSQVAVVQKDKVAVRLWDDPLKAVSQSPEARKTQATPSSDGGAPRAVASDKERAKPEIPSCKFDSPALAIAVMLQGQSYAEREEFRRRIRYAVEAAAAVHEFLPRDADFLRVAQISLPDDAPKLDIPFECLDLASGENSAKGGSPFKGMVIGWIDEGRLTEQAGAQSQTVDRLGKVAEALKQIAGTDENNVVRIIGPTTSDTLCDMGTWKGENVYSYSASNPNCYKEHPRFSVSRTISTDAELAVALEGELKRRNVDVKSDAVVLLSEYDTSYGRNVVKAFCSSWWPGRNPTGEAASAPATLSAAPDAVNCPGTHGGLSSLIRQYPRGLDGAKPGAPDADAKSKSGGDTKTANPRDFDRYEGPSQFDYLRRLADDLHHVDAQRRAKDKGGIRAIGLLGSDVYDKLLLLRALKPRFPAAIFFTTDFDASLLTSSERPFVRNLVVASGHGPALSHAWQSFVPPFRSVYQTSAFIAARIAMTESGSIPDKLHKQIGQPRLFEVTRRGGFNELLNPESPDSSAATAPQAGVPTGDAASFLDASIRQQLEPAHDLTPGQYLWLPSAACLLLAALLFIPMLLPRETEAGPSDRDQVRETKPLIVTAVAACLLFLGIAILSWKPIANWASEGGKGEVLQLVEGVTVWPTIAIRIVIIATAIVFLLAAHWSLTVNNQEIEKRFGFGFNAADIKDIQGSWPWRRYFRLIRMAIEPRELAFVPREKTKVGGQYVALSVAQGWRRYRYADRLSAKFYRVLVSTIGATILAALFYYYIGDVEPPIRGELARLVFRISLLFEFVMLSFATFYVADTTLLCLVFVNDLQYHQDVDWSAEKQDHTLSRYRQHYNQRGGGAASAEKHRKKLTDRDAASSWEVYNDRRALQFLEMRTTAIVPLVYWPFFMIAIGILGHSQIFAAYPYSATVALAEGTALAIIFACALALNLDAEDTRRQAISRLERIILRAKEPAATIADMKPQFEDMQARTLEMNRGAFSPIWAQPIIKGLVLPLLGLSAKYLLESNWWTSGW